jgi:hypothetical protein
MENTLNTLNENNTKLTQASSILNREEMKFQEDLRERIETLKYVEYQFLSASQNKDKLETDVNTKEKLTENLREEKLQLESALEKVIIRKLLLHKL